MILINESDGIPQIRDIEHAVSDVDRITAQAVLQKLLCLSFYTARHL